MNTTHPPGKRAGKGMLIASWLLVLAGLTLFFAQQEKKQYNPNQNIASSQENGITEVTLLRNKYGHYVTSGTINAAPVTFMLDTGATQVAIPAQLGAKLGLKRGPRYPVMTANGQVSVWATSINELTIGPITLKNVRAALNPGMQGTEILLGMSALKTLDFNQSGKELTLKQYSYSP
ncbi:aspartyl protease family protein [Alteromonadaceae bacterium Bs31]|nr:aspartyl protease family protein [Alteromonadaceae bacterium Bs31]